MSLAGGGAIFTEAVAALLSVQSLVGDLNLTTTVNESQGPYRPPQWNGSPATYVTAPTQNTQLGNVPGTVTTQSGTNMFVFDAVIRTEHALELQTTEHPVQGSANVTDHAYVLPARVTMEIRMSDSMDSYSANMWTGNSSKSVNAFETIKGWRDDRTLLTLTTPLNTYSQMVVSDIRAIDTYETYAGLRAIVTFKEIFIANSDTASAVSARPQTTDSTTIGQIQDATPTTSLINQHQIFVGDNSLSNQIKTAIQGVPIPVGAGTWDSNNVTGVIKVIANMPTT